MGELRGTSPLVRPLFGAKGFRKDGEMRSGEISFGILVGTIALIFGFASLPRGFVAMGLVRGRCVCGGNFAREGGRNPTLGARPIQTRRNLG